jgi:kynurenine formamidase
MSDFALSEAEFRALYERLRRTSVQGSADRLGTLNNLSSADVVAAASDVRDGHTVSLAAPIESRASADNPDPAVHQMTGPAESEDRASGLSFATDRLAMNIHGNADSHIDALCHVIFDGELYNGVAPSAVTATGASELSIDVASQGIAGRGLLLDIPRWRGVPWLEPGDHVTADDLLAAESALFDRIEQGDLVFVRVGHRARRQSLGPWDAAEARAGLHPAALELLAERRIAVLGSDGNNDTAPSAVEGVDFPVHVLAINAMGMYLLDYLDLDALAERCEAKHRASFLCVVAPLRLREGTGSPVNPIAIF